MPGMSSGVPSANPTIVSAFQAALLHQALVVVIILVLLAIAWSALRSVQLHNVAARAASSPKNEAGEPERGRNGPPKGAAVPAVPVPDEEAAHDPEPSGRRFLRIGFGLLWVFDGILQGQTSMPLGLTARVIDPTAAASSDWVQHVVNVGSRIWADHPIVASTAAVWIQLGIGLWLLVAPRGRWSKAAGVASLFWGLVVWVFGEAFGGLFAPGVSWMFGAPGAVLLYCLAGGLLVLDDHRWTTGGMGRLVLRIVGVYFLLGAILQAWPGRGFWQGATSSRPGLLAGMVSTMASTPQPHDIASWLASFAAFDDAHGFAVNLFVVAALAVCGLGLMSSRSRLVAVALIGSIVLCLGNWVLVQDLGFFGGTGTDPNSMIPIVVLICAGYLGLTRRVVEAEVLSPELELPINLEPDLGWISEPPPPEVPPTWRERVRARPAYSFRVAAAMGAVVVVLLGAAPMAAASLEGRADPIVYHALDGYPSPLDVRAPTFVLRDQFGKDLGLSELRGRAVVLTFLDPVSTMGSPVIATELRQASLLLGDQSSAVEFVGIVTNPLYRSGSAMRAFDAAEGLDDMSNWLYFTGPIAHLRTVWRSYGVDTRLERPGLAVTDSYDVFVINAAGVVRYELNANPGPGTQATEASFAGVLATTVENVLSTR